MTGLQQGGAVLLLVAWIAAWLYVHRVKRDRSDMPAPGPKAKANRDLWEQRVRDMSSRWSEPK